MRYVQKDNPHSPFQVPERTDQVARLLARFPGDGASLDAGFSFLRTTPGIIGQVTARKYLAPSRPSREKCGTAVTILGAGHGGQALAGYLAQQGHRVTLWSRSSARIAAVMALGGLHLTLPGSAVTFVPLALATTNLADALSHARRILVAVPASAHHDIARACAPFLRDGQTVLLVPGRTGGALEFHQVLREAGCRARILLGETNTFPLAARCVGSAAAVIHGAKRDMRAAALPASRTSELLAVWRPVLQNLFAARSVLHTGLANFGAILHPTIMLLKAKRIERGDSFDFYTEGLTPRIAATLAAADQERLRVARAYGVATRSVPAWIAAAYGHRADTMLEAVAGNPAYVGIKAPTTLEHRYLLEDVPTGLIPLIELAEAAGLPVLMLRSLLDRARITLGGEPWQRPRTLRSLGLAGLSPKASRAFVELERNRSACV